MKKIKDKIFHKHVKQCGEEDEESKDKSLSVQEYLLLRLKNTQEIDAVCIGENKTRINVVTDSLDARSLFGGVATSLIIASILANKMRCELRIITRDNQANPMDYENILRMNGLQRPEQVSFFSDWEKNENGASLYKLELTNSDEFIATSWWSASAIMKTTPKKFFYILQEVEPFFYTQGDERLFCEQIFHNNQIYYIVNSHYLWDYFANNKYTSIINNGIYFEPAFSSSIYNSKQMRNIGEKKKLFFYSRPNNPRNLFCFGILVLDESIKRGIIDSAEWDIYFAGQETPSLVFSNGYKPISLGVLSWQEYSSFLNSVDLTFSLMYTPHPSYPPLDAACSGSVVITNKYLNKQSFEGCENIISADLTLESLLQAFSKGIALSSNLKQRSDNFEKMSIPRNWETTISECISFIEEKLC